MSATNQGNFDAAKLFSSILVTYIPWGMGWSFNFEALVAQAILPCFYGPVNYGGFVAKNTASHVEYG